MTERRAWGRPPNLERQTAIADAVLQVLADVGARGLTHRAVDAQASLPPGTTVHHAPRRIDLLVIGSKRATELGLRDLKWLLDLTDQVSEPTVEIIVDRLLETWRERLKAANRGRIRAEIALALASSRDPMVNSAFSVPQVFLETWTNIMRRLGSTDPEAAAAEFSGMIRGRLYHQVLAGETSANAETLRALLAASLHALIHLRPTPASAPVDTANTLAKP